MIQRQDLHCTNCGVHVQFDMDFGLDGNHEITCPDCGHVHYRVVMNGRITEDRWRSSMPTFYVTNATSATSSYYIAALGGTATTTYTSSMDIAFLHDAWLQTTG